MRWCLAYSHLLLRSPSHVASLSNRVILTPFTISTLLNVGWEGDGLTDPYLWTYIGLPETIPTASHQYWMPLTSMLAALGMWVMNAPGEYAAAQWPFALMLAGLAGIGFGWVDDWAAASAHVGSGFADIVQRILHALLGHD